MLSTYPLSKLGTKAVNENDFAQNLEKNCHGADTAGAIMIFSVRIFASASGNYLILHSSYPLPQTKRWGERLEMNLQLA